MKWETTIHLRRMEHETAVLNCIEETYVRLHDTYHHRQDQSLENLMSLMRA